MKSIKKLLQTNPDITPDDEENAEERIHASEIQQKVQAIAHISAKKFQQKIHSVVVTQVLKSFPSHD